jgi:hypothetical protein
MGKNSHHDEKKFPHRKNFCRQNFTIRPDGRAAAPASPPGAVDSAAQRACQAETVPLHGRDVGPR